MEGCDTANMVKCYRLQTIEEMVDLLYVQKFLPLKKNAIRKQRERATKTPRRCKQSGGVGEVRPSASQKTSIPRTTLPPSQPSPEPPGSPPARGCGPPAPRPAAACCPASVRALAISASPGLRLRSVSSSPTRANSDSGGASRTSSLTPCPAPPRPGPRPHFAGPFIILLGSGQAPPPAVGPNHIRKILQAHPGRHWGPGDTLPYDPRCSAPAPPTMQPDPATAARLAAPASAQALRQSPPPEPLNQSPCRPPSPAHTTSGPAHLDPASRKPTHRVGASLTGGLGAGGTHRGRVGRIGQSSRSLDLETGAVFNP